jgi:cytoskeleton protein RodZ
MQNIGERLEEARKKQAVSIREAAEATKIRADFLVAFESNSMDISLPEVYVRGFLINYAKFLKLDHSKILTDYDALQLGRGKAAKKDPREFLGRMDLPAERDNVPEPPPAARGAKSGLETAAVLDKALYYKVALFFGGAVLLIIIAVLLVFLFSSSDKPALNPELRDSTSAGSDAAANVAAVETEEISLIALDDVTVTVTQVLDNQRLFTGTLTKGQTQALSKTGPIRIGYSAGDSLIVEKNGQRFKMGKSSVGSSTLE